MNFSVDNNKGKEKEKEIIIDEYDEYEEIEEEITTQSTSSSKQDPERKKLIKLLLILLGVIVIFIVVMFLLTSITNGNKTYEEIEEIMATAAEEYFADHPDSLPKKEGGTQTIDVAVLSASGYMGPLTKYTKEACAGTVKVQKTGATYAYIPNLNCGTAYISAELTTKVKSDQQVVTSGYGLYNKNGNYIFRGEEVNNYVQLETSLWRILKITSSGNVVLILDEPLLTTSPYDNRYNNVSNYKSGINTYETSRIKEALLEQYNSEKSFLSDSDKTKISTYSLCAGARGTTETGIEQAVECKLTIQDQSVGLITAADYMNASVDANCTTISSKNCQNYNWLNGPKTEWWTATPSTTNTYYAYMVGINSGIKETETYNYAAIRPVIYLNSGVLYKGGTGTQTDPYIVK